MKASVDGLVESALEGGVGGKPRAGTTGVEWDDIVSVACCSLLRRLWGVSLDNVPWLGIVSGGLGWVGEWWMEQPAVLVSWRAEERESFFRGMTQ